MIQFRDGFYADIRTEDRSRTSIAYQGGILEDGKLVGRLPELNTAAISTICWARIIWVRSMATL